jgi:peptidoglycan lytic transglycosylase
MPTARTSDESPGGGSGNRSWVIAQKAFRRILAAVALSAAVAGSGCDRSSAPASKEKPIQTVVTQSSPPVKEKNKTKPYNREGYAVWYVVPVDSLANRRAGKGEFTAAHNQLPLGSLVRVTHLANGKSVIVRITDRGITKRGASIDLCKPAAEKLEIISEGMARVRMEELPDDTGADAAPDSKLTAAHP